VGCSEVGLYVTILSLGGSISGDLCNGACWVQTLWSSKAPERSLFYFWTSHVHLFISTLCSSTGVTVSQSWGGLALDRPARPTLDPIPDGNAEGWERREPGYRGRKCWYQVVTLPRARTKHCIGARRCWKLKVTNACQLSTPISNYNRLQVKMSSSSKSGHLIEVTCKVISAAFRRLQFPHAGGLKLQGKSSSKCMQFRL